MTGVLKRIVCVTKILSGRGLPLREVEKFGYSNNRNFLGLFELISKYDTFLKEHIQKYGSAGTIDDSYNFFTWDKLIEVWNKEFLIKF